MSTQNSNNLYVGVCIAQSVVIVALAFYVGSLRTQSEEQTKENERNNFSLQMNANEISTLKARLDTCSAKK
jgi:hypothetical protein